MTLVERLRSWSYTADGVHRTAPTATMLAAADEIERLRAELDRYENKPPHCPGCDGDHL